MYPKHMIKNCSGYTLSRLELNLPVENAHSPRNCVLWSLFSRILAPVINLTLLGWFFPWLPSKEHRHWCSRLWVSLLRKDGSIWLFKHHSALISNLFSAADPRWFLSPEAKQTASCLAGSQLSLNARDQGSPAFPFGGAYGRQNNDLTKMSYHYSLEPMTML